jgi:hypothetical protein
MFALLSVSVLSLLAHVNAQANTNIDCSPVTPIDVPRYIANSMFALTDTRLLTDRL